MPIVAVALRFTIVTAGLKFPTRLSLQHNGDYQLLGYGARPDKPDLITAA